MAGGVKTTELIRQSLFVTRRLLENQNDLFFFYMGETFNYSRTEAGEQKRTFRFLQEAYEQA